jgi:hypothetical protein
MDGQEKLLDYLGREVRRLPAKHSNERAVLIHAAGVRHR